MQSLRAVAIIVVALLWAPVASAYVGPGDIGIGTYKAFFSCQFAVTSSYAAPGTNVVCVLKRDGDGAVMNVIMPSSGSVNSASIATFCTGGRSSTCFVTSATDQTGNGCDLTNSINPPQLYIDLTSGLMSIFGNFVGQTLMGSCSQSTWTVEAVASQDAAGSNLSWLLATNGSAAVGFTSGGTTAIYSNGSAQMGPSYSLNVYHSILYANTSSGYINIDGSSTAVAGGAGAFGAVNLLTDNSNKSGCNCKVGEIGILTSILSSGNQATLTTNLATRWGTPTSDGVGTNTGGCNAPPPLFAQTAGYSRQSYCVDTFTSSNVDTLKSFTSGFKEYLGTFSGLPAVSNTDFSISAGKITINNLTTNTGQYRARMSTMGNPNQTSCCSTAAATAVSGVQFSPGGYFEQCYGFDISLGPGMAGFPTSWMQTTNVVFAQDFSGTSNAYAANGLEIDFPEFASQTNFVSYIWQVPSGGKSGSQTVQSGTITGLSIGSDVIPSKIHCYGVQWVTEAQGAGTGSITWYIDRAPIAGGATFNYNGSTNILWHQYAETGPVELISDAGYQQPVTFYMVRAYQTLFPVPMGGLAANDNGLQWGERRRAAR